MREACLSDLNPGQTAYVQGVHTYDAIGRRLMDIGLVKGCRVKCLYQAPSGDPAAYLIRDAVIALRRRDGQSVSIRGE